VFLTVTDNDGATGVDSIVVEVAPAGSSNEPPVANAGGPYTGEVGEPVQFDSSKSSDEDGRIVEYLWNFGDSTPGSSEANPTHIYTKTSTNPFIVSLKVTDDKGKIANSPLTVAVISDTEEGNKAPVAEAGGPYTEVVGSTVAFDGSDSNDPDGTIASYDWDFGDGNTGTGPTPTHVYSSYGTRDVLLKVTDNAGGQAADYADVEILAEDTASDNRVPISVAGGPYFGEVGIPVVFDGSDSDDPDGTIMSYDWSFGDGNTGTGEKPSHTYASSGTYPALLRVTDDKKAQSGDFAKVVIFMNPIDELKELINQIEGSDFPKGTKESLAANLKNALNSLEKEKPNSDKVAINTLRAFINKINAQTTKKVPEGDADELKETAERIMDTIANPL
jgi:PKD repeat protein